jgi:RNA polymerase sigma-70 factor (ECF subfamily)
MQNEMPTDEVKLAARVAAGDECAIRHLFDHHYGPTRRFLRQLTRCTEDAEDLSQQTLLRALNRISCFDGRASMRSWIFTIALREYGRWRRKRLWLPLPHDRLAPGDPFNSAIDAELLLEALGKLSIHHRAAFLLHYIEGLSLEEVAETTGVPVGTIKSRLHFARKRLQSMLEKEEFHVTKPCRS